ncbi:MAG: DNA repair protein RadC [Ignavibacteriales bacterium]|nr:DNA repair protein RadC [Ignavibacteriales bacterium]
MNSRDQTERGVFEPSYYHTTIKQWPSGERPREKLSRHGPASLSEAELLAILLRSGSKGVTAVDLAKKLLSDHRTLRDLARMSVLDLGRLGIGRVRAASIVAAFELLRRLPASDGTDRPVLQAPEDVARIFSPKLRDLRHEEFWALLLTTSNHLMRELRITSGTLNSSLVHPRECFAEAITEKAASVIFVHNHPSGNHEPSQEDVAITKQLAEAGKILGIPVYDHVIIGGAQFSSFAQRGLL